MSTIQSCWIPDPSIHGPSVAGSHPNCLLTPVCHDHCTVACNRTQRYLFGCVRCLAYKSADRLDVHACAAHPYLALRRPATAAQTRAAAAKAEAAAREVAAAAAAGSSGNQATPPP